MERPRLNKLAQAELQQLRDRGITPTDEEIVWLYKLGEIATFGASDSRLLLYVSKKIGNLEIYPLTIGAKTWLSTIVEDWFSEDPIMQGLCLVYAAAHAREPEMFEFKSARLARRRITAWAIKINATDEEFERAVDEIGVSCSPPPSDSPRKLIEALLNKTKGAKFHARNWLEHLSDPGQEPLAPAIAILIKHYGQTREHWMWKESDDFCIALIQKTALEDSDAAFDKNDPAILAATALKAVTAAIIERSKVNAG